MPRKPYQNPYPRSSDSQPVTPETKSSKRGQPKKTSPKFPTTRKSGKSTRKSGTSFDDGTLMVRAIEIGAGFMFGILLAIDEMAKEKEELKNATPGPRLPDGDSEP